MKRKTTSAIIMLALLFSSMLTLALDIKPTSSEPEISTVNNIRLQSFSEKPENQAPNDLSFVSSTPLAVLRVPADYPTIQDAVNAANPGDTILIATGLYVENVRVQKTLNIVGEGTDLTIVRAANPDEDVFNIGGASYVNMTLLTVAGATSWSRSGICLSGSSHSTIESTKSVDNGIGFRLISSNDNVIANSAISSRRIAIELDSSHRNIVTNNKVSESPEGITLEKSIGNTITNNNVSEIIYNSIYLSSSDSSNLSGNFLFKSYRGIHVAYSSDNAISRNTVAENRDTGISLGFSDANILTSNVVANSKYGIICYRSSENIVSNNIITGCELATGLTSAIYNIISDNVLAGNEYGVYSRSAHFNMISHNSLMNAIQVDTLASVNVWDEDYPSGGNYWIDYTGHDLYSGPHQNVTGSDGIGDVPYIIDEDNEDRFPLVKPHLPREHDLAASLHGVLESLQLGTSTTLEASFFNIGQSDENGVELRLLIDDNIIQSKVIEKLASGSTYIMRHVWTPTIEKRYNITVYASPVSGEFSVINNVRSLVVNVYAPVAGPTILYVNPSRTDAINGSNFSIDICVANVTDLYNWQIKLYSDPSLVNFVSAIYPSGHVFEGKAFTEYLPAKLTIQIETMENRTTVDFRNPLHAVWLWRLVRRLNLTRWLDRDNNGELSSRDIVWFEQIGDPEWGPRLFFVKTIEFIGTEVRLTVQIASVVFGAALIGSEQGFVGSGTLCRLTFTGFASGYSALNFSRPLGEETFLRDSELRQIPIEVMDGNVTVRKLIGDLDGNGKVDIRDIARAALAFGSYPDHPKWNLLADVNIDGRVDIRDIALIAKNFGKP